MYISFRRVTIPLVLFFLASCGGNGGGASSAQGLIDDTTDPVNESTVDVGKVIVPEEEDSDKVDGNDSDKAKEDDDNEKGAASHIRLFQSDFESGDLAKWQTFDGGGSNHWGVESHGGNQFAVGNCYQSTGDCNDWLITPLIDLTEFESAQLSFTNAWNFGENATEQLRLLVTLDDLGDDPRSANWQDISSSVNWSPGDFEFVQSGLIDLQRFLGSALHIAFHYRTPVQNSAKWEIDDVLIEGQGFGDFPLVIEMNIPADNSAYAESALSFRAEALNGAGAPYVFSWNFGDGQSAQGKAVEHQYSQPGSYNVSLSVTDSAGELVEQSQSLLVLEHAAYQVPDTMGDIRIASFNAGFDDYDSSVESLAEFQSSDYIKAQKIAEIIQRTKADILLLNEIDGNDEGATLQAFQENYLAVSHNGSTPIEYPYTYMSDCNTGVPTHRDLNNDGSRDGPDDAYGFGSYPGKYCMAVLSKYPIDENNVRSFQKYLWKDMPGAQIPTDEMGNHWYGEDNWNILRVSSKTHLDIPITIDDKIVHVLGSHPTPPVFDGEEDRNGKRNFDEIRLFADYINPQSDYLYDDQNNQNVTLGNEERFVILGDQNASAKEGDALTVEGVNAIEQLTLSPYVNPYLHEDSPQLRIPVSAGGIENGGAENPYSSTHTAGWKIRADYVLPSAYGLKIEQSGVFWPRENDNLYYLLSPSDKSSDHRLVWMDLSLTETTVEIADTNGELGPEPQTEPYFEDDFSVGNLDLWENIVNGNSETAWEYGSFGDAAYAKANCYQQPVDCDTWLMRTVDLSRAVNPILTFASAQNYGNNPLDQISLKVSQDYAGNVDNATWVDLSDAVTWSSGNWEFVDSGDIDIRAYVGGNLTVAFHYFAPVDGAAAWEINNVVVSERPVSSSDVNINRGGTVLSNVAPHEDITGLNMINQRPRGELIFEAIDPPTNATEQGEILASGAATLNGQSVPHFGYKTLAKSGQVIDGNIYGMMKNKSGVNLFVSNYNEFTSLIAQDDRLFAISQFESIPGGVYRSEVAQDDTTGELSMVSTEALEFSAVQGGYNHCAAVPTPWNTHLASEEYEPNDAQRSAVTGEIDSFYNEIAQYHDDISLNEVNPYWYGYAVEIGLSDSPTTKHYAMGRLSIELAYVMPDRKTVYLTDDGTNGGLFLFIADEPNDLSAGSLYAMRWHGTESLEAPADVMGTADIEWLPMGYASRADVEPWIHGDSPLSFEDMFERFEPNSQNQCALGYRSINFKGSQECLLLKPGMDIAASRLETRRYAAYIGATVEMRKEEGITYNPHNHTMYLAIAEIDRGMLANNSRDLGGPDHMQLTQSNPCGGIYAMALGQNDFIESSYVAGSIKGILQGEVSDSGCQIDNIAGPDNVAYVGYDTLIITEDTSKHENNFVWAYTINTQQLTRIFSAPSGAENTGPYMFHNINGYSYITNVVQHPAGEKADPSEGNEAEVGYFGPIPVSLDVTAPSLSAYYQSAEGLSGYALKTELHNLIDDHDNQGYGALWGFFSDHSRDIYFENDNSILDIYSEIPTGNDSYNFAAMTDQCGNYRREGDCYNREHTFPRSWFGGTVEPMNSDVHQIFVSDGYVNSRRGSYAYGNVGVATYTSENGSLLGTAANDLGYTGTVFEPIDEFKGDIARAYFYMATRYEDVISGWESNNTYGDAALDGTRDKVFDDWFLTLLKAWHNQDPVSQKERDRNDAAHGYQGNRNPFIDYPEFVETIWAR